MSTVYSDTAQPAAPDAQVQSYGDPMDNRSVIDLRQIYGRLWQDRWLIGGITAALLLLGLIVTLLMTPKYSATATIQIDQEEQRILNAEDNGAAAAYQDADRFLKTNVDVLNSQRMAERVAEELNLFADNAFLELMGAPLPEADSPNVEDERRAEVLKTVRDNLGIYLPNESRVVAVTFTSPDPAFSARFANAFVESYLRYNIDRRLDKTTYGRDFLSRQLEEARTRLERAEREANTYARNSGLVRIPSLVAGVEDQTITTVDLARYNEALAEARNDRIAAQSRWEQVSGAPNMAIANVMENRALQELIARQSELSARLESELVDKQPDHPTVVPLRRQLSEINSQISALAGGIKNSIRDEFRIAAQREQQLQSRVSNLTGASQTERDRSVELNTLTREVETSRELYDDLLQRFRTLSAEANITSNNVQQIDIAQPPVEPSSPNLLLNMFIALIVGLGLSALVILVREQLDDRIRSASDLEKLNLKLLGITPMLDDGETPIDELDDSKTPLSEAFFSLRTSLNFATPDGLPKRLLVTSTRQSEGKSSTAYGIAQSIAEAGSRVILIDCDLRRPSVHKVMKVDNAQGLVDALVEDQSPANFIRKAPTKRFDFMSSGPLPTNPSDLLASNRFKHLIDELSSQYDMVILDAPPVLGLADAVILSGIDSVRTLYVVEAGESQKGAVGASLRRLAGGGAKILGAVLTRFDFNKARRLGVDGGTSYAYSYYEYEAERT